MFVVSAGENLNSLDITLLDNYSWASIVNIGKASIKTIYYEIILRCHKAFLHPFSVKFDFPLYLLNDCIACMGT